MTHAKLPVAGLLLCLVSWTAPAGEKGTPARKTPPPPKTSPPAPPRGVPMETKWSVEYGGEGLIASGDDPKFDGALPKMRVCECPSCGLRFVTPERNDRIDVSRLDRDLCPHSLGSIEKQSDLILCPRCGFSGMERIYETKLPPELQAFVRDTLTPEIQNGLQGLFTLKLEVPPQELYTFFTVKYAGRDVPSDLYLPETIRTRNALLLAERLQATQSQIGHLKMLGAWAHRRDVNRPVSGPSIGAAIHNITSSLSKSLEADPSPEAHAAGIERMIAAPGVPMVDRQLMLFMLAGNQQRLGLAAQATATLQDILRTCRTDRLWSAPGLDERAKSTLADIRAILTSESEKRLRAVAEETRLLGEAAEHIRRALSNSEYDMAIVPAQIYLVGECERRAGQFGRAYTWLEAAQHFHLPAERQGAEIWAAGQALFLREHLSRLRYERVPDNPQRNADQALLLRLLNAFKAAYPAKAPAPAAPATP